jgi:putative ABC transport system permease protein
MRLVVGGGLWMVGAGVAIGLVASALMTRLLTTLLFGVAPLDPVTFVVAPAVLTLTALAACAVPGLRAARVDPAVTLRQE